MIEIRDLTKRFGTFTAVDGISLEVSEGEIFSFLGVNGAGKTTTLRMLTGVLKPTSGRIVIGGFDLAADALQAKRITGYIPDRPHLYPGLTGREYLYFIAQLYGVEDSAAEQRIDELLSQFKLYQREDELIANYSHGMKQRVATCAALVMNPRLLVVDEPMVGLDPHGAKMLKEALRACAVRGMTIFLSTHSLNVAEELSDRIAIIDRGRIVSMGTMSELREQTGLYETDLEELFLQLTVESQVSG